MNHLNPGPFSHFRTYDADDRAIDVASDLAEHFSPFVVIQRQWEGQPRWYVFEADDEFIRKLKAQRAGVNVDEALNLYEADQSIPSFVSPTASIRELETMIQARADEPHVLLMDSSDQIRAFSSTPSAQPLAQMEARLFPNIQSSHREVDPGQIIEFALELEANPPLGDSTGILVDFPAGAETLALVAQVSSQDFVPPTGEHWFETFQIDRQLRCHPAEWLFKARAVGDRKQYSLTIIFQAAGVHLGNTVKTLPRKGLGTSAIPPMVSSRYVSIPREPGAPRVISIAKQGGIDYQLLLYRDGIPCEEPIKGLETKLMAPFFDKLEQASTYELLEEVGYGLRMDLPVPLLNFLDCREDHGIPTLFMGHDRVAPFEILQLRPDKDGTLLGLDRPIARWISDEPGGGMPSGNLEVKKVACIRPNYQCNDALPSAVEEEQYLMQHFPDLLHVANESGLKDLLNRPEVSLVHFAGHSGANPAELVLEDFRVHPESFHPRKPLLRVGHPLFFLNGCRAGHGLGGIPAVMGNFARVLLQSQCSAVVAPMIKIDSKAALRATEVFYEAITTETILEAVHRIHTLALEKDTPENHKATYLSYLAFAPPRMRLSFTNHVTL